MALVALSLIFGGGGTVNPQTEMVLQFLTAVLMVPLVVMPNWQRGLGKISTAAWVLAGLVLLVPALQLIPLPPSIWQSLPGRGVEVQSLALVGADQHWMPLTMAPARTFASLLAMICPVLVLLQISRLPLRDRNWVCLTIVIVGALSMLLGVLQLSHTGGWDWSLYSQFSEGFLVGFQANRNAEADVLLIAMLAFGVLMASRLGDGRLHAMTWIGLAMGVVPLLVGVFMTGSRTGIALVAVALLALVAMLWPAMRLKPRALAWFGGGIVGFALLGVTILQLPAVQKVIERFSFTKEPRWDLWADTVFATRQVWPYGSGVGTIVPMLETVERLEVVDPTRPVRAHNDWLEWTLEGGLPGLIALVLVSLLIGTLVIQSITASRKGGDKPLRHAQAIFAIGVLLVVALHSIVDYPLRSMSLSYLIAFAAGTVVALAAPQRNAY